MIANFPYYSFKTIDFRTGTFVVMIAMILVFGLSQSTHREYFRCWPFWRMRLRVR